MRASEHQNIRRCQGVIAPLTVYATRRLFIPQVDGAAPSTLTSADCAISGQGRPYMFGEPWAIPGYIEAEFYDLGGPGVRRGGGQAWILRG